MRLRACGIFSPAHLVGGVIVAAALSACRSAEPGPRPAAAERASYVQLQTSTSMVVRWRTAVPTAGRVDYGPAPEDLFLSARELEATREHEVRVEGLAPDRRYYYAVGNDGERVAGGDADHHFSTAPVPASPRPFRAWVLGDSGTADATAASVRAGFERFNAGERVDVWLMLGDNAYPHGSDGDYQEAVFDLFPRLLRTTPLWPAFGNHDDVASDAATESGPYFAIFTLPTAGEAGGVPSGTEAYYAFDFGNAYFICLDSTGDRSADGPMLKWLAENVAATRARWIVAFWHHPPYSKGSHDSDTERTMVEMRERAVPILERGGADLVLAGHSHSYERSYLIGGHYGPSTSLAAEMILDAGDGREQGDGPYRKPAASSGDPDGTVYVVLGSSGQVEGGRFGHPVMHASWTIPGSLVLDFDAARLRGSFVDGAGSVRDAFVIAKDAL